MGAGALPASWGQATSLQQVGLASNQLSGALPSGWSTLSNLQGLDLSGNQLSSAIPASWRPATANGAASTTGMTSLTTL